MPVALPILGSILVVSLLSLLGLAFVPLRERAFRAMILYVVSFSTGGMLGDVFLHMIPEMAEMETFASRGIFLILGGIVFSFALEKIIHWRHCHVHPADDQAHGHSLGAMNLVGDAVHNFLDGIVIATAFLVGFPVGVSTALAVIFHEIPQEVGDFAVLIHGGYSRGRALAFNFLSACAAFGGGILVLVGSAWAGGLTTLLLPFAAGNFLYIAGSDLIPELHKETGLPQAFLQLLCMVAGIAIMFGLRFLE